MIKILEILTGALFLIAKILQFIGGIFLVLFIPGFFLSLILFKEVRLIERIALSVVFSIVVNILLGFLLEFRYIRDATGGITSLNSWIYLIVISLILFLVYYISLSEKEREGLLRRVGFKKL